MALSINEIDKALRATGGFVTYAAKKLGVTYNAVYARIQKSPQLQRTLKETKESYLDLAEHSLITLMKDGNLGALAFYLKCQGKGRGYIENPKDTAVETPQAQPTKIIIEVEDGRKG